MRRDNEPHRRVDARKLLDNDGVIDVAEPGSAQIFREDHSQEAELAALLDYFERESLVLIPLQDVRRDFRLRELPNVFAELLSVRL